MNENNDNGMADNSDDINSPPATIGLPPPTGPIRVDSSTSLVGEYLMSTTPEPNSDDSSEDLGHNNINNINDITTTLPPALIPPTLGTNPPPALIPPTLGRGRPPRAPHGTDTQGRLPVPSSENHKKQVSIGDGSVLSALTDTSLGELEQRPTIERPQQLHDRHRSVSFDKTTYVPSSNVPAMIRPELMPRSARPPNLWDQIALDDIVSPMESEAETAIFRAVEAHRRQQSTATQTVLPHVPNDAIHTFEHQGVSAWSLDASESFDEKKDAYSIPSSLMGSVSSQRTFTTAPAVVATTTTSPASANVLGAPPSPTRSKVSAGSQRQSQPKIVAPGEPSLETKLFGLAAVMRDIHSTNHSTRLLNVVEPSRRRLPSADIGHPGAVLHQDVPIHDQDALVHNANLLFRRHINAPEHPQVSSIPTPNVTKQRSTWNLFGGPAGLEDPKKSDVSPESIPTTKPDIESGVSPPTDCPASDHPSDNTKSFRSKFRSTMKVDMAMQTPEVIKRARFGLKEDLDVFLSFLSPRKKWMLMYTRVFVLYLLLPTLGISTLLFYYFKNPKMSSGCWTTDDKPPVTICPAISWFLNFLILRQAIAYLLGKATGILLIDFLALKTRVLLRMFGPIATLIFVQSKGWPFQLASWAFFSLLLNSGDNDFAKHWLYYQNGIRMFNEENPTGDITNGEWNRLILWTVILLSVAVAFKRFLVGLYLGQRTYATYGNQLAKVIHQMIIISQVSLLGRELEMRVTDPILASSLIPRSRMRQTQYDWNWRGFDGTGVDDEDDEKSVVELKETNLTPVDATNTQAGRNLGTGMQNVEDTIYVDTRDPFTDSSQRVKMMELLEAWEEPDLEPGKPEKISISAILQFRQSLAFMDLSYPFSVAFGLADTREHCVESSQGVYRRLMHNNPTNVSGVLVFDAIATLAKSEPGSNSEEIDSSKMKDLIRLFRPDREGNLTMLDFVKSVDAVYKKLRLLRAAISSSSQIDRATEMIINSFFYFTAFCVILARLKIDPLAFFLSMSSVIIAFAFMIGSASSKYFEGILFILVRRPYDIGDRIAISDPATSTSPDGSSTWFVENVDLYTTTVRFASTNEVATLANGSLATTRIINAARSPKALVYLHLKFGVDVPYAKVQLFRKTVEEFVKARPREWLSLSGFRAARVESDQGYIEYVISCQHREAWQTVVPILQSKADLFSYCLEVQKQLGMRYSAPSVPVDLLVGQRPISSASQSSYEINEGVFESRRRANTSTAVDGIQALAELFAVRRDS